MVAAVVLCADVVWRAVVVSLAVLTFLAVVVFESVAVVGNGTGGDEQHLHTHVFRQFFTRSAAVAGFQQFPRCS